MILSSLDGLKTTVSPCDPCPIFKMPSLLWDGVRRIAEFVGGGKYEKISLKILKNKHVSGSKLNYREQFMIIYKYISWI